MASSRQYNLQVQRFSRAWWLGGIKTFILVTIITVLVWVFADLEFTDEIKLSATIRLKSSLKSLAVLAPKEAKVEFTLKGDQRSLQEFQRELIANNGIIEFDVAQEFSPQDKTGLIQVADIIRSAGGAQKAGLTVSMEFNSTSPIEATFDRRIRKDIDVEFAYSGAELVGEPNIQPATIGVFVASTHWDALMMNLPPGVKPTIKTAKLNLADQTERDPVTIDTTIVAKIDGTDVELENSDPDVKVTYQIDQPTITAKLKVSVRVSSPPTWFDDDTWLTFKLDRKSPLEWRKEITVVGTRKDINQLTSRQAEIDAYIVLRPQDKKEGTWWQVPVTVRFPADLQGKVKLLEEKLTVEYKLQRRLPPSEKP